MSLTSRFAGTLLRARPRRLPPIVGLSGWARCGKDSAVAALVENHGYRRDAFADRMRAFALVVNPLVQSTYHAPPLEATRRLSSVIAEYGWDGYKDSIYNDDVRALLQRLGTDAGRAILGESVWVDALMNDLEPGVPVAIADVRFPNEVEAIRSAGGVVLRVERPGNRPATALDGTVHGSDTALDGYSFDAYLTNDGTLDDLANKVGAVVADLATI